jgi:hypothetical protein
MRNFIIIGCALMLAACPSVPKPKLTGGMGAVVGKIETRAHKEMIKKAKSDEGFGGYGPTPDGKIKYSDKMVNYDKLDDIYVGLISPGASPNSATVVTATEDGLIPRAIAIGTGNRIRITNATSTPLTFYVVDPNSDAIEEISPLAPGASGEIPVPMEGLLEIAADERDDMVTAVLSRRGMQVRRVASGKYYSFADLPPGDYRLVFWYWRLGMLERRVLIEADKVAEVNEYLSVDHLYKN